MLRRFFGGAALAGRGPCCIPAWRWAAPSSPAPILLPPPLLPGGRPILLARLGRAQQLIKPVRGVCFLLIRSGRGRAAYNRAAAATSHLLADHTAPPVLFLSAQERCEEFVNALVSLVHRGMTTHLSSANGGTDQVRGQMGDRMISQALPSPLPAAPIAPAVEQPVQGRLPAQLPSVDRSTIHACMPDATLSPPLLLAYRALPAAPAAPAVQMVVMLDCRGGSSMGMARHMGLLKKFVVAMTQHYPVRCFGCLDCLSSHAAALPSWDVGVPRTASAPLGCNRCRFLPYPPLPLYCTRIPAGPPLPAAPAGAAPAAALGAARGHPSAAPRHTGQDGAVQHKRPGAASHCGFPDQEARARGRGLQGGKETGLSQAAAGLSGCRLEA